MSEDIEIPRHGPGPRPLPTNLKTTVRVIGTRQVDEFEALCVLLGRRPHQMASDLVREGLEAARRDPELGPRVRALAASRHAYQAGLRLIEGGAS